MNDGSMRPRFDRAGGHQLRQRQQFDLRLFGVQRRVGQHAVGRAQVEPQDEFRVSLPCSCQLHFHGRDDAGGSCVPDQAGNWTSAASQP